MTPRTEKGAIEKVWRVRQYLMSVRPDSIQQYLDVQAAIEITYKAQRAI